MSHRRSFQYFFKILFLLNWKFEGLHSSKKKLGNRCINKLVSPIWRGTPVFFLPWLNKFELSEGPLHKDVSRAQFSIFFQNSFFAELEIRRTTFSKKKIGNRCINKLVRAIWKRTPVFFLPWLIAITNTRVYYHGSFLNRERSLRRSMISTIPPIPPQPAIVHLTQQQRLSTYLIL